MSATSAGTAIRLIGIEPCDAQDLATCLRELQAWQKADFLFPPFHLFSLTTLHLILSYLREHCNDLGTFALMDNSTRHTDPGTTCGTWSNGIDAHGCLLTVTAPDEHVR